MESSDKIRGRVVDSRFDSDSEGCTDFGVEKTQINIYFNFGKGKTIVRD